MKNILLVLLCCVARMTCAQEVAFYDDRQVGSPIVNAFCQDADNFMWMGTGKGKRYGLPLTGVEDIVEDSGGVCLWFPRRPFIYGTHRQMAWFRFPMREKGGESAFAPRRFRRTGM